MCVCVTSKQLTVRSFFHIVRTFVQLHKKKARKQNWQIALAKTTERGMSLVKSFRSDYLDHFDRKAHEWCHLEENIERKNHPSRLKWNTNANEVLEHEGKGSVFLLLTGTIERAKREYQYLYLDLAAYHGCCYLCLSTIFGIARDDVVCSHTRP